MRHRIDLAQPRSVGEILRASVTLYLAYPLLFLPLAVAVVGPYEAALLVFANHAPLSGGGIPLVGDLLDWTLVSALVSALHIHAVAQIGDGTTPRLPDIARRGVLVLPVAVAAIIMSTLGIALGFALLVIPGIVLTLRWAVAAQAAAIENSGWQAALKRSSELTRERYLHVAGLLVTAGLIAFAVNAAAKLAASGRAHAWYAVAAGLGVHTLVRSFGALTTALLFYDLLARRTGPRRQASTEQEEPRDLD